MLRWPGGKKNSAKLLMSYAPENFRQFREPFLGGNGLILALPENIDIWLNDCFEWPVWFWRWLRDDPHCVTAIMERKVQCMRLHEHPEAARQIFSDWKFQIIEEYDPLAYLSLNLWSVAAIVSPFRPDIASFSALWRRDGWHHVNAAKIRAYQRRLQGARITLGDYADLLSAPGKGVFIFNDPPYELDDHNSPIYPFPFTADDHDVLAERLKRCPHKWLLTIGNNRHAEILYAGYKMRPRLYKGTMVHRTGERKDDKEKTELLIWK